MEPISCRILVVARAGTAPPLLGWQCLDCGRERDAQWATTEAAYTDAVNEHLRRAPQCPSTSPGLGRRCVEVDEPHRVHASKRLGVARSVWPSDREDLARWADRPPPERTMP